MIDWLAVFIARGFGSGLIKPAPGTWGSILACALAYPLVLFFGSYGVLFGALAASVVGVWAASRYSALTQTSDASEVVIDEIAGQWIALLPVAAFAPGNWVLWGLALGLFRVFDILKPGPIGLLDRRLKGGLGIMADDILAGIFAALLIWVWGIYVGF